MEKPLDIRSRWRELFVYIWIWVVTTTLLSLAAVPAINHFYGPGAADKMMGDVTFITQHIWFERIFQCVSTMLEFLLPPFIFCIIYKEKPFEFLGLNRAPSFRLLLISALIISFSLPFIFYTFQINQRIPLPDEVVELEQKIEGLTKAMLVMKTPTQLILNLLIFAFLPAVCEEFFFRGGLQRLTAKAIGNGHVAILLTALFFSYRHFEPSGFIPRFILAVVFGYMYYWSRNLWLTIFVHMAYDGLQIAALYFVGADKMEKMQPSDNMVPYTAAVVSAVLMFLAMSWLYRRTMGKWTATLEKTDDDVL